MAWSQVGVQAKTNCRFSLLGSSQFQKGRPIDLIMESKCGPSYRDLSLIRSHLLCGEFSAFSAANAIHSFPNFLFHQVPITAEWEEAIWIEKFARHFYTWSAVRIEQQTFWSWVQCLIHWATCLIVKTHTHTQIMTWVYDSNPITSGKTT